MAMFLARIKKALNLGTKSITANGTYTASSDGYDGYSSVEVNVSGGTLTNLTPSNASPATITSGNDYHATAGGYAIESYNNVTPSNSSPVALTSGDIDKMGGNGYAIQSYSIKTPSSTPVSVASSAIVKMGGSGYLINTYTSAAPSDIDPPSVSLGDIIKITGNSGYLYKTQQSGGSVKHYTTNVTFSDNTSYVYIATGKYAGLSITRGNITAAAKIRVYIKVNGSYYDLSGQLTTVNGTLTVIAPTTGTYVNTSGELYLKKDSGSNFTSTAFDFQYVQ